MLVHMLYGRTITQPHEVNQVHCYVPYGRYLKINCLSYGSWPRWSPPIKCYLGWGRWIRTIIAGSKGLSPTSPRRWRGKLDDTHLSLPIWGRWVRTILAGSKGLRPTSPRRWRGKLDDTHLSLPIWGRWVRTILAGSKGLRPT